MAAQQKMNTVTIVTQLVAPIINEMGLVLWDVRYEKEGASWYLRIFIDKDGGVSIDDCENVSRAIDKIIDEADPVGQSYYLEVSSPGIGRDLVKPAHFQQYLGSKIEVRFIRPIEGVRDFLGTLCAIDGEEVTMLLDVDGEEIEMVFQKKETSYIRLYEEISFQE